MPMTDSEFVKELDARIAQEQERVNKLQTIHAELVQAERNLNMLKSVRLTYAKEPEIHNSATPKPKRMVVLDDEKVSVVNMPYSEPKTVVFFIQKLLKEAGRPLTTAEMFSQYTKQGGTSNRATVATSLQRLYESGKIKRVGIGTYQAV